MDSGDEEDEVTMVSIGEMRVPLHEVTDDMVARMTAEEKENYIRLGQELYSHLYEWESKEERERERERERENNFVEKKEIKQEMTLVSIETSLEKWRERRESESMCERKRKNKRECISSIFYFLHIHFKTDHQ